MKHKYLIMTLMLLVVGSVQAQTRVERFNIPADSNSIIRTVDSSHVLVYTEESPGCFLLYKPGYDWAMAFRVDPKWEIRDVRVWNGIDAYFCGSFSGRALVGTFPIFPTFEGTGGINYFRFRWEGPENAVLPTDLKRLDLFYDNGVVNMAMVGDSYFYMYDPDSNTTVTSAWFDGAGWHTCSYVNKGRTMDHTDIACLDNVIVSVGTDTNRRGCYMKTFSKVQDFPCYPADPQAMYEVNDDAQGAVLVTHTAGNGAVLAHYKKGSNGHRTVFRQVGFSSATGEPLGATIDTWESVPPATVPYSDSTWAMLELNWSADVAWLLQRADYRTSVAPGLEDWLLEAPLQPFAFVADAWRPLWCVAQSMDFNSYKSYPWLSGKQDNLTVYEPWWPQASGECVMYDGIDFNHYTPTWRSLLIDDGYANDYRHYPVVIPSVFKVDVEMICEQ